ncbi:MAG: ThuA domain-containing protein, partial [Bryobacteraceae bacterium]
VPHVLFIAADDEYRSEFSMPMLARILESRHGLRTSIAYARPTPQSSKNIEGLEALATADLAVLYMRWRELPDEQLQPIVRYVESGKPLAGFRTTTHAFRYPAGSKHERLNDGFGRDVFGQRWFRHHGNRSTTRVTIAAPGEEVLRGVAAKFDAASWLYTVEPLAGDCRRLLTGVAVNPQGKDESPQPVAWTKSYKGARVFFTTLGHPLDFKVDAVRQLSVNGLLWALGREIPAGGADARVSGSYDPPPAGVPR